MKRRPGAGVHAYFSPFDSPYDAFIALMNVLTDFEQRLTNGTARVFPNDTLAAKGGCQV